MGILSTNSGVTGVPPGSDFLGDPSIYLGGELIIIFFILRFIFFWTIRNINTLKTTLARVFVSFN